MLSVWEYVKDEMQARGWNKYSLAMHMGASEMVLHLCTLDFLETEIKTIPLGHETAAALGRAFGTSAQLWLKIDESYRKQPGTEAPAHGREPNAENQAIQDRDHAEQPA